MSSPVLRDYLDRLTERYHLREIGKGYEYLGLYRGVSVHVVEFRDELTLLISAPEAELADEVLGHFAGFTHWAGAGLPADWLQGRTEDDHSCVCRLDPARLEEFGLDRALAVPDLLAQELHDHGAPEELPCQKCEERPAVVTALVNAVYQYFCDPCWQELRERAPRGRLDAEPPVRWRRVIPLLVFCSIVGALGWGTLTQGRVLILVLAVVPAVYGWALCSLILLTGTGVNLTLRMVVPTSVVLTVLAGNLWRTKAILDRLGVAVNWGQVAEFYFSFLRNNFRDEGPFLSGGIIGAALCLFWLRPRLRIRIR